MDGPACPPLDYLNEIISYMEKVFYQKKKKSQNMIIIYNSFKMEIIGTFCICSGFKMVKLENILPCYSQK